MRRCVLVAVTFCAWLGLCSIAVAYTEPSAPAGAATGQVLRVGSFHGVPGQFSSIQAAVDAAKPGDWVLIGPGDYKTTSSSTPPGTSGESPAGVLITTANIVVRGMNRNTVIVDGTKPGTPTCSDGVNDQNYGPTTSQGNAGLNGLMVWKAANVWIQNLTACNFLGGAGGDGATGNEIWWNGGANSAKIGGFGYYGSYLNATSTFYNSSQTPEQAEVSAAEYGIFSSNWDGGTWDNTYASNFNDSGYYIGACQDECNQVVDHAWAEYDALGYSGSNSGGSLVVENSQFDNNEDGFDTNSQNGDEPSPQNGTCPGGTISPITHTHSCWVFMHNYVHDNNNPNVPTAGFAAAGPVGTGMSLSGARDDTVMDNDFVNNAAWGNIIVPFPDSGPPCTGGVTTFPGISCLFDEYGDAVIDNTYTHDGYWGNPTNGDFEQVNLESGEPTDCYSGNTDTSGSLPSEDQQLESTYPVCNGQEVSANPSPEFLLQVACDSGLPLAVGVSVPCLPGTNYPRFTSISNGLHALPPASDLPTMPDVCGGVPANPWCQGQTVRVSGCAAPAVTLKLKLPVGERFTAVEVRIGGRRGGRRGGRLLRHAAHGRLAKVPLALGRAGTVRVAVVERIGVGRHAEVVRFTRVYRHC